MSSVNVTVLFAGTGSSFGEEGFSWLILTVISLLKLFHSAAAAGDLRSLVLTSSNFIAVLCAVFACF